MYLSKDVRSLIAKKVDYCRVVPKEDGSSELYQGKGIIVGVVIGVSRRIQIMVKDADEQKNQAFTLDIMCINPSEDDAKRYFEHQQAIKKLVDVHNITQKAREQEKINEVDAMNAEMFGPPLEV